MIMIGLKKLGIIDFEKLILKIIDIMRISCMYVLLIYFILYLVFIYSLIDCLKIVYMNYVCIRVLIL